MSQSEVVSPESFLFRVSRVRWLLMPEDCTAAVADQLIARLHALSLAGPEPVVLEINCARADFLGALRLFDAIRFHGTPVIGLVNGSAGTGGVIVLQACETRMATPTSEILLQPLIAVSFELPMTLSTTGENALAAMATQRTITEQMHQHMLDVLRTRINGTVEQVECLINGARIYVSASDALKEGLLDVLTGGDEGHLSRDQGK